MSHTRKRTRSRITRFAIAALVVVAAGGVATMLWHPWDEPEADSSPLDTESSVTAIATRTTLTSDLVLSAALGYGDPVSVPGRPGIVTALPQPGEEISVGEALYEVNGRPVVAIRGDRPFWRELSYGMSDGADVLQLKQALIDLGFGEDLSADETFTWETEQAIAAWQGSLGMEETGVVELGDVVAVNSEVIRVATVTAELGDDAGMGALTWTGTALTGKTELTQDQSQQIGSGTAVTITLPGGDEVPGKVTAIDPGGQMQEDGGTTTPSAVIEFDDPTVATDVGLRSVRVTLARESVDDALVVPVTALVATADGGYAVEVLRGASVQRVPVELGLIADTRAQVIGGDLGEGDTVVVAR